MYPAGVSEPDPSIAPPRVNVAMSRVRCPYCHDDVAPEAGEWVACAGCLSRHHEPCWDEGGSCSACGAEGRLAPSAPRREGVGLREVAGSDRRQDAPNVLVGGPTRLSLERTFEGEATIDDAAWLQAEVRRVAKLKGRVALEGRALVWRAVQANDCSAGTLVVTLLSDGGRTRLRIEEDQRSAAGSLFGGILGGLGGGSLGMLGAFGAETFLLLAPLYLLGLFLLVRALFGHHARKRAAVLERLLTRLTAGLTWTPPAARKRERPGGGPDAKKELA